jgi:hypothetical protein
MPLLNFQAFTRFRPRLAAGVRSLCLLLVLLAGALWNVAAFAQTSLESIELKHASAQTLVDKLVGQLLPGETAVAAGAAILLTADTSRMALIRQLVQSMDQPLRRALLEARLGPLNQLQREDAFEGNVTVTSRGNAGVLVISGTSDSARLLSQSLQMSEATKASLSLGNSKPLVFKTQQGTEPAQRPASSPASMGLSAVRIGAQSGLWLAWYAVDKQVALVELAPRSPLYDQDMPLRMTALIPLAINQWVTVAEGEDDKRSTDQAYVLQLRITLQEGQ